MLLPGGENAVVDIGKLQTTSSIRCTRGGKHKARVFAAALDIRQTDAEFLRQRLAEAALTVQAVEGEHDGYGQRYILDFECVGVGRRAKVRSAWIILTSETFPRLTTCFVLSD